MASKTLADLPRIPWKPEYAQDPIPHLVQGYLRCGPVFGLDVPGRTAERPGMVFLVGPEANRMAYSDIETFWWGPVYAPLRQVWGPTLITMDGEEHRYWRRLMQPTVTGPALARHLVRMKEIIAAHVESWGAVGRVELFESLRNLIFEVAAQVFCSVEDPEQIAALRDVYVDLAQPTTNPFEAAKFDFDPDAAERLRGFIRPMVRRAREQGSVVANALDALATTRGDDGKPLDEERVVANTFLLLLAGHETSSILSSWMLWLLGCHQAEQERLRGEIDALQEPTSVALLRQSDYLTRVLTETERLYPPLPITGRALQQDVEFADFLLPRGLFVQLSAGATHRLPTVFEEPDRFDPERFGPDRNEHRKTPFSVIGFAAGPRVCLGMPFAKVEIAEIAVQVLRRFELRSVATRQLAMHRGATTMPGEPVLVDLVPRDQRLASE